MKYIVVFTFNLRDYLKVTDVSSEMLATIRASLKTNTPIEITSKDFDDTLIVMPCNVCYIRVTAVGQ